MPVKKKAQESDSEDSKVDSSESSESEEMPIKKVPKKAVEKPKVAKSAPKKPAKKTLPVKNPVQKTGDTKYLIQKYSVVSGKLDTSVLDTKKIKSIQADSAAKAGVLIFKSLCQRNVPEAHLSLVVKEESSGDIIEMSVYSHGNKDVVGAQITVEEFDD